MEGYPAQPAQQGVFLLYEINNINSIEFINIITKTASSRQGFLGKTGKSLQGEGILKK